MSGTKEQPRKIVILGAGGNSLDVLDAMLETNARLAAPAFEVIGFLDDDPRAGGRDLHGYEVLGPLDAARRFEDCRFVFTVGSPRHFWRRESILERLGLPEHRFASVVHPSACVSRFAALGPGCVLLQHATVAAGARLGAHVMVLPGSTISHDGAIGDFTLIAGGVCVSGGVAVGRSSYLGANASIIGNVEIGERCLIGMGSVILEDVPSNSVYAGNPGRFLRATAPEGT
jgi:sugar O-acyltransferase (sialic acid O-acetyltransferase NeuD family)